MPSVWKPYLVAQWGFCIILGYRFFGNAQFGSKSHHTLVRTNAGFHTCTHYIINRQIMWYLGRVRGKSITVFPLSFGGQPWTQSNVTKFLGVYLNEHITWKYHINFVCKQMAKSVGILSRTRFYLSCKTKLMLYYTLSYPYITYCNSTWSSTYVSNLNIIYYLQKRALRAVTNSADYRAHTCPLFSKLKILDIFQINTLDIAKFMFRYHSNPLPPLFLNLFMTDSQVHTYDTRTAGNYRMHSCRTNIKKFTILYQGPRIWNCLPACFPTFKNKVPEFLLK